MQPSRRRVLAALLTAFVLSVSQAAAKDAAPEGVPGEGFDGVWQGSLKVGFVELRLLYRLTEQDGEVSGVLVSVDQGNAEVPINDAEVAGRKIVLKSDSIKGRFEASLNENGSALAGEWTQMGQSMPLTMFRLEAEPDTSRPQDPKQPLPYRAEDVTFPGGDDDVTLAGTLTVPKGAGPFPAVALLSGSGPQDRDEALMGHRPFLVLADHLTRNGIAVLRFDDRGVGESTGKFGEAGITDFTNDALAAVAYLKSRSEVDADHIGVAGHSEGGVTGPRAAVQTDDVSFVVMLAGPGVPLTQLFARQAEDVLRGAGVSDDVIQKQVGIQQKTLAMLKDIDGPEDEDAERLKEFLRKSVKEISPEIREFMGLRGDEEAEDVSETQAQMMLSPWFKELVAVDPAETLRRVRVPVLAVCGEKDIQVAATENLTAIESALRSGGNDRVTSISYPDLNHLFQHCETGQISEYGQIEETMSPEVMEQVARWIQEATEG